jgi:DNA-directed RNA polymerase II subunit RPB2
MSSSVIPAAAAAAPLEANDSPLAAIIADSRKLARHLIDKYFKTNEYPYTRHHIQSFDQFIKKDMPSIIRSNNPILLLKDYIKHSSFENQYKYKVEIFIGGENSTAITVGTPTISLQNTEEVRVLFPNEARLRNLTYGTTIYVDIFIRVTYTTIENNLPMSRVILEDTITNYPLFKIPVMLHSSLCSLNGKSSAFLQQAGECPHDHGGYFIVDGSEKILITRQEQAFNTLYTSMQKNDPLVSVYSTIQCLSPQTRQVKRVSFALMRDKKRFGADSMKSKTRPNGELMVSIPFVRKPLPVFMLFRALGIQTDEEIFDIIFPDRDGAERKILGPMLIPSIANAVPFYTKQVCVQYIKTLTKGFGEEHVLDILHNQVFIHIDDKPRARAMFLGDCVRAVLRVAAGIDTSTDKDDTRNQRCLTSGFLTQMLFAGVYKNWIRTINKLVGEEYKYNQSNYQDEQFKNIFQKTNADRIFSFGFISDGLGRGFKGRWGEGMGEEKSGVLQALSRMSYLDFMSHCRRVVSSFDTSLKLTGPRHLHPSQFGYFCTNETPGGASIGVAKNLSILAYISTGTDPSTFIDWLRRRMNIRNCNEVNNAERVSMVPIYVNAGIVGFTSTAQRLTRLLKLMKRTGWLPPTTSITFNIRNKQISIYMDEGRPVRPLIVLNNVSVAANGNNSAAGKSRAVQQTRVPYKRLLTLPTWRYLIMGNHPAREQLDLTTSTFEDPLADIDNVTFQMYEDDLIRYVSPIEYVDPYEQNESYIANFPDLIVPETTHIEIHPSTILSVINSQIPFANHNQSPRNQLGCAQSKQSLSMYATNWQNRYDNNAHILCYGESQLTRTIYQDYFGEGKLSYGQNIVLALCCYTGYNQEDGIVINRDAVDRGLFRSIAYRSYEVREEDDDIAFVKTRIGNPASITAWMDLKPGLDYGKLDDRGIVRVGQFVDEMTVIVGSYLISDRGEIKDASVTPQVWTRGRVEDVVVTVSNTGMRTVKIRISQDRKPELGDKFSNRHGQKGTIGMLLRGHDMPRTTSGLVPDFLVNPHSIPSRMTMGQLMEQIMGKVGALVGSQVDGTPFMNEGTPALAAGDQLEELGFERYGNEILYNGMTGSQIPCDIFIAPIYGMRLKHMVEDKWQARDKGRKEQRTHQPTGGRGAQGGLKIGEQERDAIVCHGAAGFQRESFMTRSDGHIFPICTGCGTVPIYNQRIGMAICSLCDGPIQFSGSTVNNLEIIPPNTKQTAEITRVEIPYATKLLEQELNVYLNMSMRFVTSKGVQKLQVPISELDESGVGDADAVLESRQLEEVAIPDLVEPADEARLEEVQEAARTLGMSLVPMASAPGLAANLLTEDVEEATAAVVAAEQAANEAAIEGGVEDRPLVEAGVSNSTVSEAEALEQAAAPVLPGEGPVFAIATDEAAMVRDGIPVGELAAAAAPLPAAGDGYAPASRGGGGRRTLGGGAGAGRRAGNANAEDREGPIAASTVVTVRKLE